MKKLITILLVFITISGYAQPDVTLKTIKVQGVDTAAMLNPYKLNYPRQAISLTTTGSSGAATFNNVSGILNIPQYSGGSSQKFTPTIVPYAGVDSILTEDAGGLFYDGTNLTVGHNNPGAYSGFNINGGRASIWAALGGMLLNTGSGFVPGTYDATKHYTFQNRGNTYLDMYSVGTGPWVHYADFKTNIRSNYLSTDSTAPTTSGTTKMLITDANGQFSFTTIPSGGGGTVTDVSALTLGTAGSDLSSSVANSTTTPVITLNVPTASASNRGALSSTDWSTFNNKLSTSTAASTYRTLTGTTGDLASFSASNTPSNISAVASGSVLKSNGVSALPVWGTLDSSYLSGSHTQTYYDLRYGGAFPNTTAKYQNGYGNFTALNADSMVKGSTNLFVISQSTVPAAYAGMLWHNTGFGNVANTNNAFFYPSGINYSSNGTLISPLTDELGVGNKTIYWNGDSWTFNFGLSGATNGFVNKVSYYKGWTLNNGGSNGATAFAANTGYLGALSQVNVWEYGINDMRLYTAANALPMYTGVLNNWIVYRTANTIVNGTSGTKTTPSDWTADSVSFVYTLATRTTVNNSPITFTIEGSTLYPCFAYDSITNVTYTIVIDGVSKGTFTNTTYPYNSGSLSSLANFMPYCQRFPNLGPGTHTVVIQKTGGTGYLRVIYVASNSRPALPFSNSDKRAYALSVGKMTQGTAGVSGYAFYGGSDASVDSFNLSIQNTLYDLASDGLQTSYIDINKFYNPHATGEVQADSLHPTNTGATHIAQGIMESLTASVLPREREALNMLQNKFKFSTGVNASNGRATLVAGTVTISTTAIRTDSQIFYAVRTPGGTQGFLSAPTASVVDKTSFTISSTSATETSTLDWWVIPN